MARTSKAQSALKEGQIIRYDTIKARLYPTAEQAELFEKTFGCCRYIWNHMLADQQRFYWETDSLFIPTPAKYKDEAPFLREVDNQALIQEHGKLTQAFRNFFKNPEHFQPPRFKQQGRDRDSYSVCNCHSPSGSTIYTTRDAIRMTKLGLVKARFPRRPESGWELKRVTVVKTNSGNYDAAILYAHPVQKPEPVIPQAENTVGLKYSLRHFYVADDGTAADPPHWLAESQEKLERIQQKLSRMEPGSKNYEEQVRKFRKLHEHIANQRRDFLHKESTRLANSRDAVCVRSDNLAKQAAAVKQGNLLESGYGQFREKLRYKLERQGKL